MFSYSPRFAECCRARSRKLSILDVIKASFELPPDPEPEAAMEICAGGGMRKGSVRDGAAEEAGAVMTS